MTMIRFLKKYDADMESLMFLDQKIKKSIVIRKSNLSKYPELTLLNEEFENEKCVSETNPQQNDYNWATVDLVHWEIDSMKLEGLLYKPEDYNDTLKYPLLVYYYEKLSNRLFKHYIPKPSRSSISPLEYASSGYTLYLCQIFTINPAILLNQHINALYLV